MKLFLNSIICILLFFIGISLHLLYGKTVSIFFAFAEPSLQATSVVEATSSMQEATVVEASIVQKSSTSTVSSLNTKRKSIDFVGDVMIARNVENIMHSYGSSYVFSNLTPHATTSYLVGNFESAIPKTHVHTPSMGFSFSVDPSLVGALTKYGFTHVGIANNHSYDFGIEGYTNMKKVLTDNKLLYFGDQRNQASSTIVYLPIDSGIVAIVGVFAVDVPPSAEEMKRLVIRAKENSDVQIAYIHFGSEYQLTHSPYQERIAHELIDDGITMVVGHHPHVVEDIELYKNRLIFYSLGNFLFDQYFSQDVQEGLTLTLELKNNMLAVAVKPVTSIGSHSSPRFMGGVEKQDFLNTLAKKSDTELSEMIKTGTLVTAR